jgi:hypothetical protein
MKFYINSEIKIPRPLSQATASNHANIFTFTLPLSEGRTGEAWEPSNKGCSFSLPAIKSTFDFNSENQNSAAPCLKPDFVLRKVFNKKH